MIAIRIEHQDSKVGMFQSCSHQNIPNHDIYREVHDSIQSIQCIPFMEAEYIGKVDEYISLLNNDGKFAVSSIEELKEHWLPNINDIVPKLSSCGFVLAVYKVKNFLRLETQLIFETASVEVINDNIPLVDILSDDFKLDILLQ